LLDDLTTEQLAMICGMRRAGTWSASKALKARADAYSLPQLEAALQRRLMAGDAGAAGGAGSEAYDPGAELAASVDLFVALQFGPGAVCKRPYRSP
jgi:hypothetical protein